MYVVDIEEADAVSAVNFCLLRPTLEGIRYDSRALRVRLEGPPYAMHPDPAGTIWSNWAALHNCSVSFAVNTRLGSLRCKQYLYDLGPLSTLDHAALYDYRQDCMRVHPLDEARVAWTGYDYRNKRALTMLAWGTNLELRELDGKHPESYLLDLARSFQPVTGDVLPPMAQRSYWSRYPRYDLNMCRLLGYRPPSSLWRWRWPWLACDHRWQTELPEMPLLGLEQRGSRVFAPGWQFDSACIFGEDVNPGEVQVLFQPLSGLGHAQLWLRQFPRAASPIREPVEVEWPELDSHSGYRGFSLTQLASHRAVRVYVASRNLRHGPHDALWWHGAHGFLLHLSAAVSHGLPQFVELLSSLLADSMEVVTADYEGEIVISKP